MIVAASVAIFEWALLDSRTQKAGFVEIQDMARTSWRQLLKLSPSVPKLTADLTEKALPVKFSKIHIVNESRIVDAIYALMRPLISNQLKQRLVFHGDKLDKLYEVVEKPLVPSELGGDWRLPCPVLSDAQIRKMMDDVGSYWKRYPVRK